MNRTELQEAVDKLDKLVKELGVVIESCGCCGSPWVRSIKGKVRIDYVEIGS